MSEWKDISEWDPRELLLRVIKHRLLAIDAYDAAVWRRLDLTETKVLEEIAGSDLETPILEGMRIHSTAELTGSYEGEPGSVVARFEDGERQMMLLAIAELSLSRPGWEASCRVLANKLAGAKMFQEFRRLNADRVKAERGPVGRGT